MKLSKATSYLKVTIFVLKRNTNSMCIHSVRNAMLIINFFVLTFVLRDSITSSINIVTSTERELAPKGDYTSKIGDIHFEK